MNVATDVITYYLKKTIQIIQYVFIETWAWMRIHVAPHNTFFLIKLSNELVIKLT